MAIAWHVTDPIPSFLQYNDAVLVLGEAKNLRRISVLHLDCSTAVCEGFLRCVSLGWGHAWQEHQWEKVWDD